MLLGHIFYRFFMFIVHRQQCYDMFSYLFYFKSFCRSHGSTVQLSDPSRYSSSFLLVPYTHYNFNVLCGRRLMQMRICRAFLVNLWLYICVNLMDRVHLAIVSDSQQLIRESWGNNVRWWLQTRWRRANNQRSQVDLSTLHKDDVNMLSISTIRFELIKWKHWGAIGKVVWTESLTINGAGVDEDYHPISW